MMGEGLQLFGCGLLAFVRIALIFVQAPIFGSNHIPNTVLVAMAVTVTVAMYPTLPVPEDVPSELLPFFGAILTQACVGLIIGFVSFLVMAAAQFGGEMLDIQMGLSVAASFDPASHGAINLIRKLQFYTAMNLYLVLDGHHMLLKAISKSFDVIPLTFFQINGDLAMHLLSLSSNLLVIGTQIAAPALSALFITQCALGLLARVAPQMNVFMLSFPLNIAIGLILLTASYPLIVRVIGRQFELNLDNLVKCIQMMMPAYK
ncbi:MAG: flagellar biosynthetic protein FliR [bacterium]|nr:flagellar biosynthetic protein FliR [bacterium]